MDTTRLQENISALADGELPASDVELTMAALAEPEGKAAWAMYRLIGDTLRADAAAVEPGPGLAARVAARLATEPLPLEDRGKETGKAAVPGPAGAIAAAGNSVGSAGPYRPAADAPARAEADAGINPDTNARASAHADADGGANTSANAAAGAEDRTTAQHGAGVPPMPAATPPAADGAAPVLVR